MLPSWKPLSGSLFGDRENGRDGAVHHVSNRKLNFLISRGILACHSRQKSCFGS